MFSSRSLKGYLPAVSFVMAKKGKTNAPAPLENQTAQDRQARQELPIATPHIASLNPAFLFLEASPTLSGPSSELLNKMIDAMSVKRDTVHVSNLADFSQVVPANSAFTYGAKVVIALGEEAARGILKSAEPLLKLRGKVHFLKTGERVIPTFHPAYLIENPSAKKDAWEDLKLALREMSAP